MKKFILILMMTNSFRVQADLFGGDVVVLSQILIENILQLQKLKMIVINGKSHYELLKNPTSHPTWPRSSPAFPSTTGCAASWA